MIKNLEKRMYFLVMYNLKGIQQGIQCGHAQEEYSRENNKDEDFQDWSKNWKTWIVLNGGTSNEGKVGLYGRAPEKGSMELHYDALIENGIKVSKFHEPDLNSSLSAIALIVDERVFNKDDYPDFEGYLAKTKKDFAINFNMEITEQYAEEYKEWKKFIGGEKNVFLKEFLSPRNFRMA